jgi:hypothetical protein
MNPVKELKNMSFPEAVIRGEKNLKFERDWQEVIAQAEKGKPLPKKIYMEGTEPLYKVDDKSQWVRVVSPNAVELEGAAMGHSVGKYKTESSYGKGGKEAFKAGTARVFSLRNEKGIPSLTVETTFKDDAYQIHQVKSVFNSEPSAAEKKIVFSYCGVSNLIRHYKKSLCNLMQSLLVNHTNNGIDSTILACVNKADKVCILLCNCDLSAIYLLSIKLLDILELPFLNFLESLSLLVL